MSLCGKRSGSEITQSKSRRYTIRENRIRELEEEYCGKPNINNLSAWISSWNGKVLYMTL